MFYIRCCFPVARVSRPWLRSHREMSSSEALALRRDVESSRAQHGPRVMGFGADESWSYRVWKPNLNPKWAEIHGQTLALSPDQYHGLLRQVGPEGTQGKLIPLMETRSPERPSIVVGWPSCLRTKCHGPHSDYQAGNGFVFTRGHSCLTLWRSLLP